MFSTTIYLCAALCGNGLSQIISKSVGLLTLRSNVLVAIDPLGFFPGTVLSQGTSEPQPNTGEFRETHEYVSCRRDMSEIMLKIA